MERQRLTLPIPEPPASNGAAEVSRGKKPSAVAPADEATLAEAGLGDGGVLNIKDLGKQISWTTVFVIEYVSIHLKSLVEDGW